MQPHQERVVAESNELRDRLHKLTAFIGGQIFKTLDPMDQNLLVKQQTHMADYLEILRQRIARFA